MLEHAYDGYTTAFHFGDVLVAHMLERIGVRCKSDGVLYVVLPSIDATTVDDVRRLLSLTCYNEKSMRVGYEFIYVRILTRQLTDELRELATEAGREDGEPRVCVAVDSGLGFRMLGFRSADKSLLITGSLIQRMQCGAHFLAFVTAKEACDRVFDFLDSETRVHRVSLIAKSNVHAKGV